MMKNNYNRLDDEKVDSFTLAAELESKADVVVLTEKADKSELELVTLETHKLIDDLLGKLLSLVSTTERF